MTELTYREAVAHAIADEMWADDRVFLIGEDVAAAGGVFKATEGLLDRFGPMRVRDTPISEQAIVGCAIGAAMRGLRPIAEIMFADFAAVCFDQIANQLAKCRYMTGGQVAVPVTLRFAGGAGIGFGAQHSQAAENWFLGTAGLKICVPATVEDAYGLLRAAIRDPDPVLVFEHKHLYAMKVSKWGEGRIVELGHARIARSGQHATVVATQAMLHRALEAADALAGEGIEIEVIDPRTLVPLDLETIRESVARTNRLLCVQEHPPGGSWGATLIARLVASDFELFDAPPVLVGGDETPIPYAEALEAAWIPDAGRIAGAVRDTVSY